MIADMIYEPYDSFKLSQDELEFLRKKIPDILMKASCTYPFNLNEIIDKYNMNKYYDFIEEVYITYQTKKKEQGLSDFNDLMVLFSDFLNSDKSIDFKNIIDNIFFDEYQDINPIQNFILSKFYPKSNIMVVGDDAQAIYSFRGANIKYIFDFGKKFTPNKIYKLEKNYRSSPNIVNFFQNIISHNKKQFVKKVKSMQEKKGSKPQIICQEYDEQYKWVINDIKSKINDGKKYSDMVVLARKNSSINDIEILMIKNKIPCIKQIGMSLLNKNHIKDFLAFVTILINNKSVLHWKRILAIHKNIREANIILNHSSNILESLEYFINKSKTYKNFLEELYNFIKSLCKIKKPIDQCRQILDYLTKLWSKNKSINIDAKVEDIKTLLNYLNDLKLEEFVSELYLNIEIDAIEEDNLLLSTIHGAKGLEWKYVYIIDMSSKDFPLIISNNFKDQLELMDEERRLFFVAASRAKKFLTITCGERKNQKNKIIISPFIRELDNNLYSSVNLEINYFQLTGKITSEIEMYIKYIGYSKLGNFLQNMNYIKTNTNLIIDIPKYLNQVEEKFILASFFNYLVPKLIKNNFNKKANKLNIDRLKTFSNCSKKAIADYIDPHEDWIDNLKSIFHLATFSIKNKESVKLYKNFLLSKESLQFYKKLQENIFNFIKDKKVKKIIINKKLNYKSIYGNIKLLLNDHLIEFKYSERDSNTINNISYCCILAFLLKKKDIVINKITIYNIVLGEYYTYDTTNINFSKFQKTIYKK